MQSPVNLPTPDFTYDPKTDLIAGIRPCRKGSFRLEAEQFGPKLVVHNYGHGGAGITMAPGCAHAVCDIIRSSGLASAGTPIAVLGGGVMGLTVATLLSKLHMRVTMYAQAFTDTTSDRAGGQWAPSLVNHEDTAAAKRRFEDILRRAFYDYVAMIGNIYGVSRRPNYTWVETTSFKKVPHDLIPPPTPLPRLPFEGHTNEGFEYQTLLVEPPIFLNRLRIELRIAGVAMTQVNFTSPQQILDLSEPLVVNCLGLGSRRVWPDSKLFPIKGQLVLLRSQPCLQYLYSGAPQGYIFPRQDKVAVGGTQEECNEDETPHDGMCAEVIRGHVDAFAGRMSMTRVLPDWIAKYK